MSWPELENAFNYCKLFWIWKSSLWKTYIYYIIHLTVFSGLSCMLVDCSSTRYFLSLSQFLPSICTTISQNISVNWAAGNIFSYILWSDNILPFFKKRESFAFCIFQVWMAVLQKSTWFGKQIDLAKCWCSAYAAIFSKYIWSWFECLRLCG